MSDPSPAAHAWEPLDPHERRVLGVLIEKQKTSKSADAYPMTLNSIVVGANQKSNRDPIVDLDDDDVEDVLTRASRRGLVTKVTGSRVDRFRHLLYEAWKVTKVEMAVLAELLLRGPQTEGDLRGRASRMDEIKDLEELRAILAALAGRNLVVFLTEPNRRGTVVTHGFHTPDELTREKARHAGGAADAEPAPVRGGGSDSRLAEALDDIAKLKDAVARLEREVQELRVRG